MKEKKPIYGGQALIEGVMFTGQNTSVSAILRNNKTVDYFEAKRAEKETYKKIKKIPFLRGIVALLQSSAIGVKHLDFASDRFERDPKEDHKIAEEADKNTSKLTMYLGVGLVGVLSLLLGKVIFTLIPALIANFFTWLVPSHMG